MSKLESFNGNGSDGPAAVSSSNHPRRFGGQAYLAALTIATLLMVLAPITYLFVQAVENWPTFNLTFDSPSQTQSEQ